MSKPPAPMILVGAPGQPREPVPPRAPKSWPARGSGWIAALLLPLAVAGQPPRSPEYSAVQASLCRGWNTWDVHSVATQVLLPQGFAIRVGLVHNSTLNSDAFLPEIQIGRQGRSDETVRPGPHTWDGSYTEARVSWHGHELILQSARDGDDLIMLATPGGPGPALPPTLVVSAGVLWGLPGGSVNKGDHIELFNSSSRVLAYWTGATRAPAAGPLPAASFAARFDGPVGVCTGHPRSVEQIRTALARRRPSGDSTLQAIESAIGWTTLYDPTHSRVISPVSRLWSESWGGYVLFEWDTFFAAALSAAGSRELAYANAMEALNEATPDGFVPNYARAGGWKSFDRSEPPVGAITVLGLYMRFHDAWFLRDTFDPLLRWNRWWDLHRELGGYIVLGSDPRREPSNPDDREVGTLQGAKYESGLDNSPIYDDAPFDQASGRMHLADVGMTSLYVADCRALEDIARILGRRQDERELRERAARYGARLRTLWDEKAGIFLNRNLDTGAASLRLSPTNFYPMLAGVATPRQASRMVKEHLLNPSEFWGEWVIPSIARSDAAFQDQNYWRGRIWGPMNYLVYLGLLNYDQPGARRQLAQRSLALFNKEWAQNGHVHENYNAITGSGCDVGSSDRFYHWGALLALIGRIEERGATSQEGAVALGPDAP